MQPGGPGQDPVVDRAEGQRFERGMAVHVDVEGQPGTIRVGPVLQHLGQGVAQPEVGVGGQRGAKTLDVHYLLSLIR